MIKADGSRVLRKFRKGLEGVVRLAAILAQLEHLQNASALETESDLPAQLQALIAQAADVLRTMIAAQAELEADEDDEDGDAGSDDEESDEGEEESDEEDSDEEPEDALGGTIGPATVIP